MNSRVVAAQQALEEGRRDEAVELLTAALSDDPSLTADVWLLLARQLYFAGRLPEADSWTERAVTRHSQSHELWNIRGVVLRMLKRPSEALAALNRAIELRPDEMPARLNRVNVLLDTGQGGEAAPQLRAILAVKPDYIEGWMRLAGLETDKPDSALAILDEGMTRNPDHPRLLAARALVLREAGRRADHIGWLEELVRRFPEQAWPFYDLGQLLVTADHDRAVALLRQAVRLEPSLNHRIALANALCRWGTGGTEALEEAWSLCRDALEAKELAPEQAMVLREVFTRVLALEEIGRLGDPTRLARAYVARGQRLPPLWQMAEVVSDADRLELMAQHRGWGDAAQRRADKTPLIRPGPRPRGGKIRLGLLSSDLRSHPVGRFAAPLFDHLDQDRFELFAYSFHVDDKDKTQARLAQLATNFRRWPGITSREAAQCIADDQLDMLIELGGSTGMNRPEVLAWSPAPIQASWLGYPHSIGLSAIDYLICDPHNAPVRPDLLVEKPLMMPESWVVLGDYYVDREQVIPELPQDRTGVITFGTANAPYKYNRATLDAWARTLAAVPGSRFAFIRPEAGAPTFQAKVAAWFAAKGVAADRLVFRPVWGDHMRTYNEIDITLDPFPLTGGTTTADALWMGVPVVSLAGPSFFERLSRSLLVNAGLGDLCVESVEDYVRTAVSLASDRTRRAFLRRGLRNQIKAGALGRPDVFARDFYDLIARTVAGPG